MDHPQQPTCHHQGPTHHDASSQHISQTTYDISVQRRLAATSNLPHDDRDSLSSPAPPFPGSSSGSLYGTGRETLKGEPPSIPPPTDERFAHSVTTSSPHVLYDRPRLLDMIKTEDSPVTVPSQTGNCLPSPASMHGLPCPFPHRDLVQYTDDLAAQETQHLRRRCHNCHTTAPPSWRRSVLHPGKIVCSKCGLYERTRFHPHPLRLDQSRAGKQPKTGGSRKVRKLPPVMKAEDEEPQMVQRHSVVSSLNGLSRSGTASSSDGGDNAVSLGSLPQLSYNFSALSMRPISCDPTSQSPLLAPRDGGIRPPDAPLSDFALPMQSPLQHPSSVSSLPRVQHPAAME